MSDTIQTTDPRPVPTSWEEAGAFKVPDQARAVYGAQFEGFGDGYDAMDAAKREGDIDVWQFPTTEWQRLEASKAAS